MVTEGGSDDSPSRDEIGLPWGSDEDGRLHDVGELRAATLQSRAEVGHHLMGLAGDIANGDSVAVNVQRTGTSGEHKPPRSGDRGVGIRRRGTRCVRRPGPVHGGR